MNKINRFLHKLIYYSVPYGILKRHWRKKREERESVNFYRQYDSFVKSNNRKEFGPNRLFSVISVEGLGFSGSGAVIDFLREFSNTLCVGSINDEAIDASRIATQNYEVDILRLSGGLFDIERYIESNNVFHGQAVLQRFVDMSESFPLYVEIEEAKESFFRFFYAITRRVHCTMKHPCYNSYLYRCKERLSRYEIFYLKRMTISEYRIIARNFLSEIFQILSPQEKVLVLDQLCNDLDSDIQKYLDYIPNLKIIHVYRDPRDVYEYAIQYNVEWIAHYSVVDFIDWFKIMTTNFSKMENESQLYVRFEDLVNCYEMEKSRIETFLDFDNKNHIYKVKFFNPAISRNNIAIWKKDIQRIEEFNHIERELKEFCYQ